VGGELDCKAQHNPTRAARAVVAGRVAVIDDIHKVRRVGGIR